MQKSTPVGVALMCTVALFGAIDATIVKMISPSVHPFIIAFTRSLFGLLLVLPWIVSHPALLQSNYRFLHLVRASLKLASLIAFFAAYTLASLADVTAIAFTAPIFVTIGAWVFLAERPQVIRIACVTIGFIGVLIVLRPTHQDGMSTGLLLALLGAILAAIIQLILKPMSARDSTETLVAWNLILTVPLAAIPAFLVWKMPSIWEWALLSIQGVFGVLAMSMVTKAFALADASLLAPIDFIRLPIVALLAYLFFEQVSGVTTWVGAGVIFLSTLLMAHSATTNKKQKMEAV